MAKFVNVLRKDKSKIEERQFKRRCMLEYRKLAVEIRRCLYHKRSHVPVRWKLEYARWDRRNKARMRQKKFRKG